MDTPAFSHYDEFASVDQVLHRLHRATDVGRCVLDGQEARGRFRSPVAIMNLRHEFRRDLRRQFGYEDFIEHCGTAWSFQ